MKKIVSVIMSVLIGGSVLFNGVMANASVVDVKGNNGPKTEMVGQRGPSAMLPVKYDKLREEYTYELFHWRPGQTIETTVTSDNRYIYYKYDFN